MVIKEDKVIVENLGSIFFFKQKTAYEMLRSLVGSERCIRDRFHPEFKSRPNRPHPLFADFIRAALEHKKEN